MANPPPIRLSIEGEDRTRAAWQSAIGNANSAARSITSSMKSAFGGIGALSVVGIGAGIAATVRNSISLADQLGVLGQKSGIAVSELSALKYASEQLDVEFSSLEDGLVKLQRTQSEAVNGSKEQAKAFTQLGISVDDIRGMRADELFRVIADKVKGLGNESDRTKALVDIFGRAGADLLPLMMEGAKGITALTDRAKDLGIALNDADVDKLREFGDRIAEMNSRWDIFTTNLLGEWAPGFSRILENSTKKTDTWLERLATGSSIITQLLPLIVQFNQGLADAAEPPRARGTINRKPDGLKNGPTPEEQAAAKAAAAAAKAARAKYLADLKAAQELTRTEEEKLLADIQDFLAALDKLRAAKPEEGGITQEQRDARLLEYLKGRLPKAPTIEKADEDMKKAGDSFKDTVRGMSVYADEAARGMQQAFADFLFDPFRNGLKGMLRDFLNVIRRMLGEAAAAKIMEALTGGSGKTSKGGGNFFTDLLGGLLGGGGGGFGGDKSGGITKLPGDIYKMPTGMSLKGYAQGGDPSGLSPIVVGERRPEVFWPKTPGRVLPSVGGNSVTIAPVYHTDARGATPDALRMLPAMFAENNRQMVQLLRRQLADDRSRGRA